MLCSQLNALMQTAFRRQTPFRGQTPAGHSELSSRITGAQNVEDRQVLWAFLRGVNVAVGVTVMVVLGYVHANFMATIHENDMWFSNIKVGSLYFYSQCRGGSMISEMGVGRSLLSLV